MLAQNGELPHVNIAVRTTVPETEEQPELPPEQLYGHETAADKEQMRREALHHVSLLCVTITVSFTWNTEVLLAMPWFCA